MFSSLRFRLWLTYVLIAGLVIGISGIVMLFYFLRYPAADRRELQRLRVISGIIANRSENFQPALEEGSPDNLHWATARVDRQMGVRVAVYDQAGYLLSDSRQGKAAQLPELSTLSDQRIPVFRDVDGRQWLFVTSQFESGDTLLLALPRLRTPIWTLLKEEILPSFGRGVLLALTLSLIMAIWISSWIAAPMKRIAAAARELSVQKFHRLEQEGPQEVKDLAGAFNEMGERLQAGQKAQQDFIANVSHDLKTPLTSIQGFAQAILDGTAQNPDAIRQAAAVIHDEAERMYRMVVELLELARYDSGTANLEFKEIDPDLLLLEVVEEFKPVAVQRGVSLEWKSRLAVPGPVDGAQSQSPAGLTPRQPDIIRGDVDRLKQVFTNLVDNALKFTPPGGMVSVEATSQDQWLEITVEDSGPGIPPEAKERIFERFYQVDQSRAGGGQRGLGLGLAIAREIVQAHGGSIYVLDKAHSSAQQPSDPATPYPVTGCIFVVRLALVLPDNPATSGQKGTGLATGTVRPRRI